MSSYFEEHRDEQRRDAGGDLHSNLRNILRDLGHDTESVDYKPPASRAVIDALPTSLISAEDYENDTACAVCLDVFALGSHPTRLPCFHMYHKECIIAWLEKHHDCPTCRHKLETDDERYNEKQTLDRIETSSPPPSMFG
eukprot:CFRG8551T1